MTMILIAVLVLGAIGLVSALILWIVAKKFAVKEDPRIGQVGALLPQANCGGCGFPGCSAMAEACVKAADKGSLDGLCCPVAGNECMVKIATLLGLKAEAAAPKIAVVRCNGTCALRSHVLNYDGVTNCRIANTTGKGETLCAYGCLGCGDCVEACQFDAIHINPATGLPEVDKDKCTSCGACAKACPRNIIEIRQVDDQKSTMLVQCMNKDKGAQARKACGAACIGCMKCQQACGSDAITIENFLAYIDPVKCTQCRACEEVCPQGSIIGLNMEANPKRIEPKAVSQQAKAAVTAQTTTSETPVENAPVAANTNIKPYDKPLEIDFDAPLLPSQQYLLHGTIDLTPADTKSESATDKDRNFDAPLLPSQQIMLGL